MRKIRAQQISAWFVASTVAVALVLNVCYTTWSIHHAFQVSCFTLRAEAASSFYPPNLHRDFTRLRQERGC
jgi:hypothetical protein